MKKQDHHKTRLSALLRQMIRIRQLEKELVRQYDLGNIRGTLHCYDGQEAIAAGCGEHIDKGDFITSTHRGHGHLLASGAVPKKIIAELFGRRDGYCHGKGGTQHIACLEKGFLGSNGITGGGIPIATGLGLALALKKKPSKVFCFFGDGASNQGTFHESLNMAAIWNLPILYICENNGFAMGSKTASMINTANIASRAAAYGLKSTTVDGNDVLAVSKAVREAAASVSNGDGPMLIEAQTYRLAGHSRSDRCHYRSKKEEESWRQQCPIVRLETTMLSKGILSRTEADILKHEAEAEMAAASEFARSSALLNKNEILTGVYSE